MWGHSQTDHSQENKLSPVGGTSPWDFSLGASSSIEFNLERSQAVLWSLCLPKEIFFSVYICTRQFKYQFVSFRRRSHVLFLKLHDRKLNSVLFFLLWLPTSQTGFGNHLTFPVLKPACCFRIDSGFSRHLCAWRGVSVYSHVTAHVGSEDS